MIGVTKGSHTYLRYEIMMKIPETYLRNRSSTSKYSNVNEPKTNMIAATVVGVLFKGGLIIGSYSRLTKDELIVNNNYKPYFKLSDTSICFGAGIGADVFHVARLAISKPERKQHLSSGNCTTKEIATWLSDQMSMGIRREYGYTVHYIVGGFDSNEYQLYHIGNDGKLVTHPYLSIEYGSSAANLILKNEWKQDMNKDEAISLVSKAVMSSKHNMALSQKCVQMMVMENYGTIVELNMDGVKVEFNKREIPRGATEVLSVTVTP